MWTSVPWRERILIAFLVVLLSSVIVWGCQLRALRRKFVLLSENWSKEEVVGVRKGLLPVSRGKCES